MKRDSLTVRSVPVVHVRCEALTRLIAVHPLVARLGFSKISLDTVINDDDAEAAGDEVYRL